MDMQRRAKRSHRGTWFVVLLGLLEIGAVVAFLELKGATRAVCDYSGATAVGGFAAGAGMLPLGSGGQEPQASDPPAAVNAPPPLAATSVPQSTQSPDGTASENAADASASGDTSQIVDPNCVARTAAGLLNSGPASPTEATCGPMKQPEALKNAEKQLAH